MRSTHHSDWDLWFGFGLQHVFQEIYHWMQVFKQFLNNLRIYSLTFHWPTVKHDNHQIQVYDDNTLHIIVHAKQSQ